MQKREWGTESNGKLPHLFIPSKTATFVPEFAVEDLPFDTTSTAVEDLPLVPEFSVKDLPLGRTLIMMRYKYVYEHLYTKICLVYARKCYKMK